MRARGHSLAYIHAFKTCIDIRQNLVGNCAAEYGQFVRPNGFISLRADQDDLISLHNLRIRPDVNGYPVHADPADDWPTPRPY